MTLLADPDVAEDLRREAEGLPTHVLSEAQRDDLELLLAGAYAPLTGFLRMADVVAVEARRTLASGVPFAVPVTLDTDLDVRRGDRVALRDEDGTLLAVLAVEEVRDGRLAGPVEGVALPVHPDHRDLRATPAAVRDLVGERRPGVVVARRPLHRPDLDRLKRLAVDGRLVVVTAPAAPLPPRARGAEAPPLELDALVRAHRDALADLPDRAPLHVLFPLPRLRPGEQRDLADRLFARTLGGELVPLPDDGTDAKVRRLLAAGATVPPELSPPLVVSGLSEVVAPRRAQGFTVLVVGTPQVAARLAAWLRIEGSRPVTLLDAETARRELGADPGRDPDAARRLAWVAGQLARHRGAVVLPLPAFPRPGELALLEGEGGLVTVDATGAAAADVRARPGQDPDEAADRVLDHLRAVGLLGG